MAPATLKTRKGQWTCYLRFCKNYDLTALPCSTEQACLYATFLADYMLASSISAYLQALTFFHMLKGFQPPILSDRRVKATLNGIRNKQAVPKRQKDPIQVSHLLSMYKYVDKDSVVEVCFWAAALLLFRTLLRVSHVTASDHNLRMADFVATDWGYVVSVRSSKVAKPYHKVQTYPVYWLKRSWAKRRLTPSAPAFAVGGATPLTYSVFIRVLKKLAKCAGLKEDLASHSFRRGGATLMAHLDCSLTEIKSRGRWSSDCVFDYLKPTVLDELNTDFKVSSYCSNYQ